MQIPLNSIAWLQILGGALIALGLVEWRRGGRTSWAFLQLAAGAVLAFGPLLVSSDRPSSGRSIRVLSVLDLPTTTALVEAFEEETGIRCEVDPFTGGAQRSANLLAEGRLQPDVYLGGTAEVHDRLADAKVTLAVDLPEDPDRIDRYDDPDRLYVPIYLGYLALIHRPLADLLQHPPEWNSLLDPRWRGRIFLPSPTSTSGGLVFLATQMLRQDSPERGWTYLELLEGQDVRWTLRSEDVISGVANGDADLGVAWAHDTWRRRENGRIPVELHIPERTGYEVGAVSLLRWARDQEAARAFIEFLTGPRAARLQVRVGYRIPLRTDVAPPRYITERDPLAGGRLDFFDRQRVLAEREGWIERFASEQSGR